MKGGSHRRRHGCWLRRGCRRRHHGCIVVVVACLKIKLKNSPHEGGLPLLLSSPGAAIAIIAAIVVVVVSW